MTHIIFLLWNFGIGIAANNKFRNKYPETIPKYINSGTWLSSAYSAEKFNETPGTTFK